MTLVVLVTGMQVAIIGIFLVLWRWMIRRDHALAQTLRESLRQRHELDLLRQYAAAKTSAHPPADEGNPNPTAEEHRAETSRMRTIEKQQYY